MMALVDGREIVTSLANDNPSVAELQFIRENPEGVQVELLESKANHVWLVRSENKHTSVIIKHYRPTLRHDPEWEVPMARMRVEYNSLVLLDGIEPGCVPKPYCLDTKHNIIAMEYLSSGWTTLKVQHETHKKISPTLASHYGAVLGKLHKHTSQLNVTQQQWNDLKAKFQHPDFNETIYDAFCEKHLERQWVQDRFSSDFLPQYDDLVAEIRNQGLFEKLKTLHKSEMCLILPDCNKGNVLTRDGKVALLDLEFNHLGHPAVNVASAVKPFLEVYTNLPLPRGNKDPNYVLIKAQMLQAAESFLQSYMDVRTDLPNKDLSIESFFSAITLLVGTYLMNMVRWEEDLSTTVLLDGFKLITSHHQVKSLSDILNVLREL